MIISFTEYEELLEFIPNQANENFRFNRKT